MDITTKKINDANAEISAAITRQQIDANIEKIAKELSKTANIAGFRKGKVPASAVKRHYGDRLVQDAEAEALRELLNEGLKLMEIENSALIGEPQIVKFDKTDDLIDVMVKVAMRPLIELGTYHDMVEPFEKPKITAQQVNDRIKELAEAQAPMKELKTVRPLKDGDIALIDFEGYKDGEKFEGGSAEGHSLKLGSGQFIPGFEEQLIGMKKGDEKTIDVTFPESYGNADLAGQPVQFKVKVNGIQKKETPKLDDELAKKMMPGEEEATLVALKEKVKEQLENEALTALYRDELKPSLLESLVEAFVFDLPEFVVEQEMDLALNRKAQELSEEELKEIKDNQEKVQELRETFRDDAVRSVRATFIIDALAQAEGLSVSDEELMQTIYYEAMMNGMDPAQTYENYKESGYLPAIQMSMLEDKVLSALLNGKSK